MELSSAIKKQGVNVLVNMFSEYCLTLLEVLSMQVYGVVSQFSYSIGPKLSRRRLLRY